MKSGELMGLGWDTRCIIKAKHVGNGERENQIDHSTGYVAGTKARGWELGASSLAYKVKDGVVC